MKKVLISLLLSLASIEAEEQKSIEFGVTTAYSSYGLDIKASQFDRAIAYDVMEAQLGVSYNKDDFQIGMNYTGVPQEIKTRSSIKQTDGKDIASIDRRAYLFFASYIWYPADEINKGRDHAMNHADWFSLHFQYYNSLLDASNEFVIDRTFRHDYKYDADGLKLSFHYNVNPNRGKHTFWITGGTVYTKADLNFNEYRDDELQPKYVDSLIDSWGYNVGGGWRYDYSNQITS